ncbi:MAG TPA: hypothetical protein VGX76_00865 [Pirellulales bacterium]|jgi:hypothetical protein|nr:hypothetical protein [Pirellulales bacterium]
MAIRLLLSLATAFFCLSSSHAAPREIDEARAKAHGIRKLTGRTMTLFTDLPADLEVDRLPDWFDRAVPQWTRYFGDAPESAKAWRVTGHLMKEKERFLASGLLPDALPEFANGYSTANEIWWYDQSSAYYRRHLMFHEGTHAYMFTRFGTCGPPWYMEGMAELLGTHALAADGPRLGVFPARADDVRSWGRIGLVRKAVADGRRLSLAEVMAYGPRAHLESEPYGWCWAATAFLDSHPRYRERFRSLPAELSHQEFNGRVRAVFADDWRELDEEWQVFVGAIEYGYDLERNAVEFVAGETLPRGGKKVSIRSDRGWQSSRVRLQAGSTYELTAMGRYQLAAGPPVWWCEPNGVTIRYWHGRPLGQLLAAVRYDDPNAPSGLVRPTVVGLRAELTPEKSGTLYLRINDSPAELADNEGTLTVSVTVRGP